MAANKSVRAVVLQANGRSFSIGGDTSADALISVMEGMEFEGPKGTITIRPEELANRCGDLAVGSLSGE